MPEKIYRRNIFTGIFSILYLLVLIIGTLYISWQPRFVWDNVTIILLIIIYSMALGYVYFLGLPAFRRDPVLIIDVDKIRNIPSDITIYWNEVYEISLKNGKYPYLLFTMADDSPDVRVGLAYTFENNTSIYKTVLKYFEYSLKTDDQLAYKQEDD